MSTQDKEDFEVIDLTNDTKLNETNITITLDDTLVPAREDPSDDDYISTVSSQNARQQSQSPILIGSERDYDLKNNQGELVLESSRSPTCDLLSSASVVSSPTASIEPYQEFTTDSPLVRSPTSPSLSIVASSFSDSPVAPEVKKKRRQSPRVTKKATLLLERQARAEAKKLKQKQKEQDDLHKKANRANAVSHALDNCTAVIDEQIFSLINDPEQTTLKTLFDESMIKYRTTNEPEIPFSISWTYKRVEVVDDDCITRYRSSSWLLIFIPGEQYLEMIQAYKYNCNGPRSLKTFLKELRSKSDSDVILFVFNLSNHLKGERLKEAKNYRKKFDEKFGNARSNEPFNSRSPSSTVGSIGITELQDLRLMLEIEAKHEDPKLKLHVEFYEKSADICQAIVRLTLSVARLEAKQKIRASTGIDWAINMDKEKAVDPTKSEESLTKLWITQLQQFSQVTLPIAKAIAAEYPNPGALLDQYRSLTKDEAEELLAELPVQRNLRRLIGSNISKKIHCFLTCEDPDVHIGLS